MHKWTVSSKLYPQCCLDSIQHEKTVSENRNSFQKRFRGYPILLEV